MKMLRTTIEITNRAIGAIRANRRVPVPPELPCICINLGCGLAVEKGWINIDGSLNALVSSMPTAIHRLVYRLTGAKQYYSESEYCRLLKEHIFIHHDLAKGIPLNDCAADYVYTSHFVEHLYRGDALHLLRDCYRVLKIGGVLRVSIPDLAFAISLYAAGKKDEMLQNYFFVEDDENQYSRHKYMYDFEMLELQLKDIGFREIVRRKYREGVVPDIQLLDNRPDESLFIEAIK